MTKSLFASADELPDLAQDTVNLIKRINFKLRDAEGIDRRKEGRYPLVRSALVQILDDNLQPVGDPLEAFTRDISKNGLGLLVKRPVPEQAIAIRLQKEDGSPIEIVARVIRCESVGSMYDIGCQITPSS
ncbi:MAG: PilZ domain-containing protein [Planctomycetes bacterium]|nr:PilZ domain-containing protein [Planctomycetota bacterium]